LGVACVAALGLWLVFYPGSLSPDSIDHYRQAHYSGFTGWHPVILPAMLSLLLYVGIDLAGMMLLQCLAGVLGLRFLATNLVEWISDRSTPATHWTGTAVALVILSPLTPTSIYFITYWKDCWTAIALVWAAGLSVWLYRCGEQLTRRRFSAWVLGLIVLMIWSGLPRYNTITATPALGGLLAVVLSRRHVRAAWLAIAIPVVGVWAAGIGVNYFLKVKKMYPENHVKAVDLIGLYVQYPAIRADMPYTSSCLKEGVEKINYRETMVLVAHAECVSEGFVECGEPNPQLNAEHARMICRHPLALACIKWKAFWRLLNPENLRADFWRGAVEPNIYKIQQNEVFRPVREKWCDAAYFSCGVPVLEWIACHRVWLGINLITFAFAGWQALRRRSAATCLAWALLLLPLLYTLGFVLATTGADYRFLFPSTLLMQTYAGAWLAARVVGLAALDRPS
jgi:hypothetical protein